MSEVRNATSDNYFLRKLGLIPTQIKQILNNQPVLDKLYNWVSSYDGRCSNTAANLLIVLATKYSSQGSIGSQNEIAKLVLYQIIDTSDRLYAAMKLAKKSGLHTIVNQMDFCEYCHVGEDCSQEEICLEVQKFLIRNAKNIEWSNLSTFFNRLRKKLFYADKSKIFIELRAQMQKILGPQYLSSNNEKVTVPELTIDFDMSPEVIAHDIIRIVQCGKDSKKTVETLVSIIKAIKNT